MTKTADDNKEPGEKAIRKIRPNQTLCNRALAQASNQAAQQAFPTAAGKQLKYLPKRSHDFKSGEESMEHPELIRVGEDSMCTPYSTDPKPPLCGTAQQPITQKGNFHDIGIEKKRERDPG